MKEIKLKKIEELKKQSDGLKHSILNDLLE